MRSEKQGTSHPSGQNQATGDPGRDQGTKGLETPVMLLSFGMSPENMGRQGWGTQVSGHGQDCVCRRERSGWRWELCFI